MQEPGKLTVEEVMDRIKQAMTVIKLNNDLSPEQERQQTFVPENSNHMEAKLNQMDMEIRQNNLKWNINNEWLITSHRKYIGKIIVFGKKVARKLLRWYINPPWDQQREFNGSVTRSINLMGDMIHLLMQQNLDLNRQVIELNQQNDIQSDIDLLKSNINEIDKQIESQHNLNDTILNSFNDINIQVSNINTRLTVSQSAFIEICKTVMFFFAEKNPELSMALAVELIKLFGDQEFIDFAHQLNERITLREYHA